MLPSSQRLPSPKPALRANGTCTLRSRGQCFGGNVLVMSHLPQPTSAQPASVYISRVQ
jgi:hypothetical protein